MKQQIPMISCEALGVLLTSVNMSGGVSIKALVNQLNSSEKVIQNALSELKSYDLAITTTSSFNGRHVSCTKITENGMKFAFGQYVQLKKTFWGYGDPKAV